MESIGIDELYDERGDVALSRMIFQGDIFRDVCLPGFGPELHVVQIVAHPCSMRAGTRLNKRVTVAPVVRHQKVSGSAWNGHFGVMPLAELQEDAIHYAATFNDITAAPSAELTLEKRIASLTDRGIYVLQQRLIKHYTRLEVEPAVLARESAIPIWELHQLRDWIETVLEDETRWTAENLEIEESAFAAWLDEGAPTRRERLKTDHHHSELRRAAHRAAVSRASSSG